MGINVETLAVAKKYTNESIEGITGVLAGKNATIDSITDITGGHRVTFKWTADNGDVRTQSMDVMDGADGQDGKGIKTVAVNSSNHLIITYDDDTTVDAGEIDIHSAVNSVNGKTGNVDLTASDVGALPDNTSIPSKTSDLTNDSDFVADASYVHTDNNYDATAKDIVDGVTTALASKVDKETGKSLIDLTTVVDGASYDSANHLILFKNGTTTLFSLDAAAFVKDGMVDTVEITGGNLVITFNTDAGKQAISIPLTDIFDPANYYTKTATDGLLADKADKTSVYKTVIVDATTLGYKVNYIPLNNVYSTTALITSVYLITNRNGGSSLLFLGRRTGSGKSVPYLLRLNKNDIEVAAVYYDTSTGAIELKLDTTNYTSYITITQIGGQRCDFSVGTITDTTELTDYVSIVSYAKTTDLTSKADKVTSATAGNLASLDANGNLTDSNISPSSVASKSAKVLASSDDLNNVTTPGFYYTANSDNPSNIPSGTNVNNNIIEVIKQGGISRCVQLFYSINAQKMWFRIGNSVTNPTTWSSWDQIAFGSLATKADKVTNATSGDLASLDANGNLVDSRISKNTILDSGICAHGENLNSLESKTIMSYLNSLDSNIKFATFYVMPNATNVTDKIDTTNVYTYSCYRTGASLATWVITAIATIDSSLIYVASFGSSSTEITWKKLVTESDITPSGTRKTTHRNYTNITSQAVFDTDGVLTKTPIELINALKNKGYVTATSGYEQLHCTINMENSNTNKIIISDGTHSIDLVNGWIEFKGAFVSGTSTFNAEERWVMKLYNVSTGEMAIVTKRAGANPFMKSVALT